MSQAATQSNKLFTLFLILLCLQPLPHGGERLHEYLPFAFGFGLLLAIKMVSRGNPLLPTKLTALRQPLWLFIASLGYLLLQTISLPVGITNLFSPASVALQQAATETPITFATISVAPQATLEELLKQASYLCLFLLTLQLLNSRKRVWQLLSTLFFCSATLALYSIVNHMTHGALSFNEPIPPWTVPWEKAARGTVSYKNHYAAWLNMTLLLGPGLIHNWLKRNNKLPEKFNRYFLMQSLNSPIAFYVVGMLLMLTAQLITASRGGLIFLLITATIMASYWLATRPKTESKRKAIMPIIALLAVIAALLFSGIGTNTLQRFEKNGTSSNGRDKMHLTVEKIMQDYALAGTGGGSYPHIQQQYKSERLGNTEMSKRAHCDYLELLSSYGIIGTVIYGLSLLILLFHAFSSLLNIRSSQFIVSLSLCGSLASLLMHSVADWNFPLPMISVSFFVLLAAAIRLPSLSTSRSD